MTVSLVLLPRYSATLDDVMDEAEDHMGLMIEAQELEREIDVHLLAKNG